MVLTLNALAELEAHLGETSLVALIERFESNQFSASDLMALLHAGLRGGGWQGAPEELGKATIKGGVVAAAKAAGQLLSVSFGPA